MMIVGLTGGIASGKSMVTEYLRAKNVPVVDADAVSRSLTAPGGKALKKIQKAFGQDMVTDGVLDRKRLAALCFASDENTAVLNGILHPLVQKEMRRQTKALHAPVVFWDVPLLLETGMESQCDKVAVVLCDREERIRRAFERSGLSRREVLDRMARQADDDLRRKKADFCLINETTLADLYAQVDKMLEEIL